HVSGLTVARARDARFCAEPGSDHCVEADAVFEHLLPFTAFDEEAGVLRHLRRGGVVRAAAHLAPMYAEAIVQMVHEAPQGRRCQSGAPCGGADPVGGPRARVPTFDTGGPDIAVDAPLRLDDADVGASRPCRLGAVDLLDPCSGTVEAAVIGDVAGQVRIGARIDLGQGAGALGPPRSQEGVHPPTLSTRAPPYPCSADAPQTE